MRTRAIHIVTVVVALLAVLASSTIVAHAACDGDCPEFRKTSCCPDEAAEEPSTAAEVTGASADCCIEGAVYEQSVAVLLDYGCDASGVDISSLQALTPLPEVLAATAAQVKIAPLHASPHVKRRETATIVLQR